MKYKKAQDGNISWIIIGAIMIIAFIAITMWVLPKYKIYRLDLSGQADLREAEWTKKILIEQAKAERDSATLQAERDLERAKGFSLSEVERAKGVAEANRIIGDSLKGNDVYLRYLWIQGLHDGNSEIIYIPTEANLPILEAGRLR